MNQGNILFIEDEAALAEIVKESLEAKGFQVYHAATLAEAALLYTRYPPAIIVADVMLPDGSGFEWVAAIRKADTTTQVIFLTSRSQTKDVVLGFEMGGNDYLKKPFSIAELEVRIKSLLNRTITTVSTSKKETAVWEIGKYTFLYPAGELVSESKKRQLTSREADLLHLLLLNRNEPLHRNDLLQALWGNTDYFSGRSLDVFISKLRGYLNLDSSIKIINLRGIGYKLIY
ncbi:MAG: response regulator transcription factor [Chitinophagaceae bacterium]|nr:MAG: response regulator transcription factor [Chitinophagaceae bacterium]